MFVVFLLFLFPAQLLACMCAGGLVECMFPGDIGVVNTSLSGGTSIAQGVFIEMFMTAELVFVVLMLAAEKSKSTSRATFPVQGVNTVQAFTSRADHLTLHAVLVLLLLHERLSPTTGYTGLALYLVHSLLRHTTALSSTSITSRRILAKILLVVTSLHECPENAEEI